METKTDHQSFILKPSTIKGVGVFALHAIAKDTYLELFREHFEEEVREVEDVPEALEGYCLNREDGKRTRRVGLRHHGSSAYDSV